MESIGKYWNSVYNILENDCAIALARPKYVQAIRGKKTDKKNAKWIADLFKHDLVAESFCPRATFSQLARHLYDIKNHEKMHELVRVSIVFRFSHNN